MARATGRSHQIDKNRINYVPALIDNQITTSKELAQKHRLELGGERLESIEECRSFERGSAIGNPQVEGYLKATAIKAGSNVGNEHKKKLAATNQRSPELSINCDKSIKRCIRCHRFKPTVPVDNSSTLPRHRTVYKCGMQQRCGENQVIQVISPASLMNYEQNIHSDNLDVQLPDYSETSLDATCCTDLLESACLARPLAGAKPARSDEKPSDQSLDEVVSCECHLKDAHRSIAAGGACACYTSKFIKTPSLDQQFTHQIGGKIYHNSSDCLGNKQNQTLSSPLTALALTEKQKYSPPSLLHSSLPRVNHQTVSQSPYVTRINLTNELQQKPIDQFFSSRTSSLSLSDGASVEEFKKYCDFNTESKSDTTLDLIDGTSLDKAIDIDKWHRLNWEEAARRYREMPCQHRGRFWWQMGHSCFCNLITKTLFNLFPILSAFGNYSLPGDLINDLVAGFTIAVLQIPQGMAYGLLAGVEPIYGLYVSLVPVLIMAFMSKSRHVSYGTFAMISMLLVNATESAKLIFKQRFALQAAIAKPLADVGAKELTGLVVTNNHQPIDPSQQMLRNLIMPSNLAAKDDVESSNWTTTDDAIAPLWPLLNQAGFVMPTNIEILTTICLLVGIIQVGMALVRLGVLSLMFGDQLVSSFTVASALHVISSQLGPLFDLDLPAIPDRVFKIFYTCLAFATKLNEGFNQYTALLSFGSILFLMIVKELIEPAVKRRFNSVTCLPSELVLMGFLIFGSWYWKLEEDFNIKIIGDVPTGLPAPKLPRLEIVPLVFQEAFTIALVSFAMNLSLVQLYAKRYKYSTDPNQELFALGTSNLVGSFFSCFPCASSLSRSAVQSSLNVKSPLCSLFSCTVVVSIICYFAPILHDLPRSTLSCIIIVALKGILVQAKDLYENWRLSKLDALVWMATFISVLALGITYGLVMGIVASLFMILFRLLTPNHSILGQLPNSDIYVDKSAFVDSKEIEQVKIFRFNSALCYLNRTMFKSCVEKSLPSIYNRNGFTLLCMKKQPIENEENKTLFLIIDCSALAYCDYSGAATLVDIIEELQIHGVSAFLAACPLKLINMIERMQRFDVLEKNIFPSIAEAISYIRHMRNRTSTLHLISSSTGSIDAKHKPDIANFKS